MSATALIAVTTIGVVWGAAGVVIYIAASRTLKFPAQPAEQSNLDILDDLLDDQPAEILTGDALTQRFDKILVANGMKGVR